ncbi:MAG: mechanosensitive ion channel [Cytophagaceae bacterium]
MFRSILNFIPLFFLLVLTTHAQDSINVFAIDTANAAALKEYKLKLKELEHQRIEDYLKKVDLEDQLSKLKTTDNLKKQQLEKQLKSIEEKEYDRIEAKKAHINSLRNSTIGFPVLGVMHDTIFKIYTKIASSSPSERAANITEKIHRLYEDDFFHPDSIKIVKSEYTIDVVYDDMIILTVSENDAIWYQKSMQELAEEAVQKIKSSISTAREELSWTKMLTRVGMVLLVIVIVWFIFWLLKKGHNRILAYLETNKTSWLKSLKYNDYIFLSANQEFQIIKALLRVTLWFIYALLLYISLPVIFSIFPFSRNWADALFSLIWDPLKDIFVAVWDYIPNLISIVIIFFVMKYVIRLVKYIFNEIELKKLKITGFHADWAMPTFSIIRFLLYAFMFVLIFPYLPGSDSNIFKGVSVFIGVLFSLGSSSAIANVISGLVITYMRPFKIGDRIKIGEVTGDVIEKTLLVTRVKTIKNEIITIPNSAVLTGNTTNYTSEAQDNGLILYTTVTIGYDVPWRDMHKALIEAALRTNMILEEPKPFVFQTSLDDFYVSYQLNAFTRDAGKQALIYSLLHQNIQDVCNEKGIEIMSPHYRSQRDGNQTTIPANYKQGDQSKPGFNFRPDKLD